MGDVVVVPVQPIIITAEQKDLVKHTVAPDATDAELQLYFYDCTRRGVHPLDRLIHFTKRGGKYTPITSIDMFRIRAAETTEHMGTDEPTYEGQLGQNDFKATVIVYRKVQGEKCAFSGTARWSEYFPGEQQGFLWHKMPHLMLAKCAEALALRKAFPAQLHGLYTPEEMAQAGNQEAPRTVGGALLFYKGKMAGKSPAEVESGYLRWYLEKVKDGEPALLEAVKAELTKREAGGAPSGAPVPEAPAPLPPITDSQWMDKITYLEDDPDRRQVMIEALKQSHVGRASLIQDRPAFLATCREVGKAKGITVEV